MSRNINSIALYCVLATSMACGRPDKGRPAEQNSASPVETAAAPAPVVDLRIPIIEVPEPPPPELKVAPAPNLKARLGKFKITYYWVAHEPATDKGKVAIIDRNCKTLAKVSKNFRRKLQLEGSGKLKDGRMINRAGGCKCGPCYWVTDDDYRWGAGVANRALKPFRSIAVDPKEVRIGTSLYVAELDGLTMPGAGGGEGGFVHDGCVVADDRGGGVRGKQIDLFAARREHYYNFFARNKITRVSVYKGGKRCSANSQSGKSTPRARSGSI